VPFTAWLAVSEVGKAAWVLAVVRVDVLGVVVAAVAVVVSSDVAPTVGGSGREMGGWKACWGSVGRLGGGCCRSPDAGASFEAGNEVVVVVVVNNVVDIDGGCAGVISGDAAHGGGDDGLVWVSSWGAVCIAASAVEVEAVWVVESTMRVAVVWVLESVVPRVVDSVCMLSSTRTHVRGSTHLPWPCFVSHTSRSAVLPLSSPSFTPLSYPSFSPINFTAWSCVSCVSSSIGP
jgi:hypothetical protein